MTRQQIILFTIAAASASLSGVLIYYSLTQATAKAQNAPGQTVETIKAPALAKPAGALSSRIKPNMRAVSIPFKDEGGVETLVAANDSVDVIVTRAAQGKNAESETVLYGARVLIGAQTQNSPAGARPARLHLVTLEVTSEEAELLATARSAGKLSLVLAGASDLEVTVARRTGHSQVKVFKFGAPTAVLSYTVRPESTP